MQSRSVVLDEDALGTKANDADRKSAESNEIIFCKTDLSNANIGEGIEGGNADDGRRESPSNLENLSTPTSSEIGKEAILSLKIESTKEELEEVSVESVKSQNCDDTNTSPEVEEARQTEDMRELSITSDEDGEGPSMSNKENLFEKGDTFRDESNFDPETDLKGWTECCYYDAPSIAHAAAALGYFHVSNTIQ